MAHLPTQPYRGTRDFLPEEMSVRAQIFDTLFKAVETYGFQRYHGPTLEAAAIYEAKSGEELANQQLYRLTDKGGRDLALRPEMTPTVARMIAGNAGKVQLPARWYSHVACFRYERPQRGRVREHFQLNVDLFGSDSFEAEVEIFEVVAAIMKALGAPRELYELRVNDRVLIEGALLHHVGVPEDKLIEASLVIDRWEKVDADKRAATMAELGLSAEQQAKLGELLTMDLDAYREAAGPEHAERSSLAQILSGGMTTAPVVFDPGIVRGLAYYTGTVFEVFDVSPDNRRSIFGGGRYDNLVGLFSNQQISGIGFGMGDVTTWNFLETHGLLPEVDIAPEVYLWATDSNYRGSLRELLGSLRDADVRAVPALGETSMKAGLKQASRMGARFAVALSEHEMAEGRVLVKDLSSGEQHTPTLGEALQALLAARG